METLAPTPLESALLREFYALYGRKGFPPPTAITITERENTGAGRYVKLTDSTPREMENGYLDLAGKFIEMDGIPHGMMAVVLVKDGHPVELEIATYGVVTWDGTERSWLLK